MEKEISLPRSMLTILLMALVVFWVWGARPFKDQNLNKIALPFGLVLLFWFATIFLRWFMNQASISSANGEEKKGLTDRPFFTLSNDFKCFLGQDNCEKGDFNIWTLGHIFFYLLVGLYVPNYYLLIFVISVAFEMIENGMGFASKYVLDVGFNLVGYAAGSGLALLWQKRRRSRETSLNFL